jgi:hypothetical protein
MAAVLVLTLATATAVTAEAASSYLASLQWKNRVLVVLAPSAQDDNLAAQRRIYQQNTAGMSERQITLVEAIGDDQRSRDIRKQFSLAGDKFRVLLLGKDGNTALSSAAPLTADKLFGAIDAMPMRRDEMRRQGK